MVLDFVQSRIEAFNTEQGGGVAVRKDAHGYTLLHQDSGMPSGLARDTGDLFGATGALSANAGSPSARWRGGPLLLDELEFIANDPMDCFWR